MKRYTVIQLPNGAYGVDDAKSTFICVDDDGTEHSSKTVAFGMTQEQATDFADRRNLREAWGV